MDLQKEYIKAANPLPINAIILDSIHVEYKTNSSIKSAVNQLKDLHNDMSFFEQKYFSMFSTSVINDFIEDTPYLKYLSINNKKTLKNKIQNPNFNINLILNNKLVKSIQNNSETKYKKLMAIIYDLNLLYDIKEHIKNNQSIIKIFNNQKYKIIVDLENTYFYIKNLIQNPLNTSRINIYNLIYEMYDYIFNTIYKSNYEIIYVNREFGYINNGYSFEDINNSKYSANINNSHILTIYLQKYLNNTSEDPNSQHGNQFTTELRYLERPIFSEIDDYVIYSLKFIFGQQDPMILISSDDLMRWQPKGIFNPNYQIFHSQSKIGPNLNIYKFIDMYLDIFCRKSQDICYV